MTSNNNKNVIIGIDLGTTYSCLAVWKDGQPIVIPSASGRTMPSWVSFLGGTKKLVGQKAKDQASLHPANTVYDVKRILGRSFHDNVVQDEMKHLSYSIVEGRNGEPKIQVCNKNMELSPEEVSAMILSKCLIEAGMEIKMEIVLIAYTLFPFHILMPFPYR